MLYAKKGDLVSAEKLFRQSLEDDPNYKEGRLNLGLVLAQQNRKPDAEKEFDKAIALAPKDPALLSTIGKAEMKMGKFKEGTALLRQVVDLAPDLAAAHLDLALALSDSYNFAAALDQANDAIRLAPQSAFAHFYRGRVLYDLGRNEEAQPEFEAARRLNAQMAEPRYFLALIHKQGGDYEVAAALLEETVRLQPKNAMAWYMLGQCFEKLSDPAKTTAVWRKAIEADPGFTQALISLARALQTSDPMESERLRARYAEVQKKRRVLDRADTLANNGIESASAHDWPGAIQQMQEAIRACGDCAAKADLHRKLGIIDCQAGDLSNGEKELLEAKALRPDDPVTQAALELIAQARTHNPASVATTPR
jgi:tetratricopeptide (TPR) repeat protein